MYVCIYVCMCVCMYVLNNLCLKVSFAVYRHSDEFNALRYECHIATDQCFSTDVKT